MIRIALCDDEAKMLDEVSSYLKTYASKKSDTGIDVFCFDSAKAVSNALDDGKLFDIFVLDVYIGDEMGTDLAKNIRKRGIDSPIVFLTTSVEHAPESFETGTLRYLIKPINPTKFYEAMDVSLAGAEKIGQRLIKLKTENGVESINASHIMYSEAHDHYQYVTLSGGEVIKIRMTVAELFTILARHGGFIRVGSPYIINLRQVKNVSRTAVSFYSDKSIPIPRGKYKEIKDAFWDYQYEGEED